MWTLGAMFGVLLLVIGVNPRDIMSNRDKEIEKILARMNEQGPNN